MTRTSTQPSYQSPKKEQLELQTLVLCFIPGIMRPSPPCFLSV